MKLSKLTKYKIKHIKSLNESELDNLENYFNLLSEADKKFVIDSAKAEYERLSKKIDNRKFNVLKSDNYANAKYRYRLEHGDFWLAMSFISGGVVLGSIIALVMEPNETFTFSLTGISGVMATPVLLLVASTSYNECNATTFEGYKHPIYRMHEKRFDNYVKKHKRIESFVETLEEKRG